MGYRLAYSTNAYTKWLLVKAVEDVKRLGYEGVEILADAPHAFPPLSDRGIEELRQALKGLGISNLNGNTVQDKFTPSLIAADGAERRERIEYTKRTIDLARALGAENVCTCTGFLPKGMAKREASKHLLASFEPILAYAEKKPEVRVGIEYEPGFFIGERDGLLAFFEEMDHPLLGANLDLGHAECVKEDLAETIGAIGPRIWNLHIEDIKGRVHEHLIPGLGDIDFAKIRKGLDKIGYRRFVTLEIYPYKDDPSGAGARSLEVLRRHFS